MQCSFANIPKPGDDSYLNLECPYGKITEVPDNGIGINKYTQSIRDACVMNQTTFHNEKCSSAVDRHALEFVFDLYCSGKSTCNIKFSDKYYNSGAKMNDECTD